MDTSGGTSQTADKSKDFILLCACHGQEQQRKCKEMKLPDATNLFATLDALKELLDEGAFTFIKPERTAEKEWTWTKVDGCKLYYVLVYNEIGNRLPERDTIASRDSPRYKLPKDVTISDAKIRVISLFEKTDHGFVKIIKMKGLRDYDLVVDLPTVKNLNRVSSRLFPTRFGFLCTSYETCEDVKRVASKQVKCGSPTEVAAARREINAAIEAGGQFNTKYWACSKYTDGDAFWVAMDLCIVTFDVLIKKKSSDNEYLIDDTKMQICFRHILQGLNHLHSNRIKHGKMKLTNILLSLDGKNLKICEYAHITKQTEKGSDQDMKDQDIKDTADMFLESLMRGSESESEYKSESKFESKSESRSESKSKDINKLSCLAPKEITQDSWIKDLQGLTGNLSKNKNGYRCLSAYLIMHMRTDKPNVLEVLQHPFFWSESKILTFILRMEGCFFNLKMEAAKKEKNEKMKTNLKKRSGAAKLGKRKSDDVTKNDQGKDHNVKVNDVLKSIYANFNTAFGILWRDGLNWVEYLETFSEEEKSMDNTWAIKHKEKAWRVWENAPYKENYNQTHITSYMRLIRNTYAHYHQVSDFKSTAEIWECFGNILPEMICLLHRAVWFERDDEYLLDDLQQYFTEPNNAEELNLRRGEIEMNYYENKT